MDYFIIHCEERNVLNILSSALKGWTPNWRPALSRDAMQIHENMLNIQYINGMTDLVFFFCYSNIPVPSLVLQEISAVVVGVANANH